METDNTEATKDGTIDFAQLTPAEKLICALYGEPFPCEGLRHFLDEKGTRAVEDLLNPEILAKYYKTGTKASCERGVKVLRLRIGFIPRTEEEKKKKRLFDTRTLDETRLYFGVTSERIRQIEAKMLRVIRLSGYGFLLKPYLTPAQEERRVDIETTRLLVLARKKGGIIASAREKTRHWKRAALYE